MQALQVHFIFMVSVGEQLNWSQLQNGLQLYLKQFDKFLVVLPPHVDDL